MLNEYYFKEKLDEIDSARESIRFNNSIIDECEKKLENPDEESYDKLIETITHHSDYIDKTKARIVKLEEEFNERCLFATRLTLSFITRLLNDICESKFELIATGNEYIIVAKDGEERYTFPESEKFNLYRFITERGALIDKHPEIKEIICDILNRRAEMSLYSNYDDKQEMQIFQMVYATIPANHPEILKEKPLMHSGFKDIVNDLVRNIYGGSYITATVDDFKEVYKNIMAGNLNSLMENEYWFGANVDSNSLANIVAYARMYGVKINLTRENYIVYAALAEILDHVKYLDKYGEMYIRVNGHTQTKATEAERQVIDDIASEVFKTDYTWREAREVAESLRNLNFMEDYKFPHDVSALRDAIDVKPITLFDKIEDVDLKSDIVKLKDEATNLVAKMHAKGDIRELFNEPSKSYEEEYLRRMVLANWDVSRVFKDKKIGSLKMNAIAEELVKGTHLSNDTLSTLFDIENYDYQAKKNAHEEKLVDLACGTLLAFTKSERIENLWKKCKEIQFGFNIKSGTVGYYDVNTHALPNHDALVSIPHDAIKPKFSKLQRQYDYLYEHASDAEFLEGAIEIYGDILVMQAFRSGNKRTAKSLFNAMLLSRGIIPPVTDLHEQGKKLWLDIAIGRFERYTKAKYKLLLQTADVKRQFKEQNFKEPLPLYDMEVDEWARNK